MAVTYWIPADHVGGSAVIVDDHDLAWQVRIGQHRGPTATGQVSSARAYVMTHGRADITDV